MAFDLASIQKENAFRAPRVMLYGPHGMGKTTFGAGAPSPIFIQTEDGLGLLEVPHFPLAESYRDVLEAISTLYNEAHEYQTVVIDSVDWLESLINVHINGSFKAQDLAYGKGAVFAADCFREILDGLSALRNDKNMACILISHSEIRRFDSPETEPFDRYQPKLQSRASALIQEWCDAVLFTNLKVVIKEVDIGFSGSARRGITTGERLIYTQEKPAFLAKNRYGLADSMPLSWQAFQSALLPIPDKAA